MRTTRSAKAATSVKPAAKKEVKAKATKSKAPCKESKESTDVAANNSDNQDQQQELLIKKTVKELKEICVEYNIDTKGKVRIS